MSTTEIVEKFTTVEAALAEFIIQTNRSFNQLHGEMREFKDEMRDFKDEMREYKEESRRINRDMNKQWGALANKMGTLVEDIIAPAVRPVLKSFFKEGITHRAVHVRKQITAQGLRGEFDVIAASQSYVFLIETKSNPQRQHLQELAEEVMPRFRALFPEFASLQIIPVLASLRFEDDFLEWATEAGIYLLAYREWEYLNLLNFTALQPTGLA